MLFRPSRLNGAMLIVPQPVSDERGRFMRTFCADAFGEVGLETNFVQHSLSTSTAAGTVRGMHFQEAPHEEVKVVRCVSGAIYDVIVDLRPGSPTFGQWEGFELTAANGHQVYVPKGFAHGHQTLTSNAAVHYLISTAYAPEASRGIRHDDPMLGIVWPQPISVISSKDLGWPRLA